MTAFIRLLNVPREHKDSVLLSLVRALNSGEKSDLVDVSVFEADPDSMAVVPGTPFAYWVPPRVRDLFRRGCRLEAEGRIARQGLCTNDDFRWLRLSWECGPSKGDEPAARPFAKGGAFSPFYADVFLAVRWGADGRWIKEWKLDQLRLGKTTPNNSKCWNESLYFRRGITWPRRTSGLSFRVLPQGCAFADKGPTAFVDGDSEEALLALCALVNTSSFGYLVSAQLARTELAQSYEVGIVQETPIPDLLPHDRRQLARLARRAWLLRRRLDTANETSHAFMLPPGLNESVTGLDRGSAETELQAIQKQLNELAFGLYGIGPDEQIVIQASSKGAASSQASAEDMGDEDEEDSNEGDARIGAAADATVSWLLGVAFGRFDPRLATGERPIPLEPEPFDPLPTRSPGMWPEGEDLAERPDILIDDEGHADDLAARVRAVADRVHVDVPENLRGWLAKQFFPLHIKMYSKSRRKAPIYWQLATPSASYSIWLYIHAFSKDTLFRAQNDYAAPKLAHEERRLESLTSELRDKATAAQRKELAAQESVVEELRAFLEEVKRVAPLWNPNLDDGVIINFAPLWRLVPQHKSWQKELKSTWDALCEGNYDWAHLAMYLWPERVVPNCAKDRSVAIAHGLEDVFWVEDAEGKWTARKPPTRSIDELVRDRTSPAVKSAIKSLLEGQAATGNGARGRGRRAVVTAEGGDA